MMQDVVLLVSVAAVFAFGFLVMGWLDAFLDRNAKEMKDETTQNGVDAGLRKAERRAGNSYRKKV